jgi:hypothetical protein
MRDTRTASKRGVSPLSRLSIVIALSASALLSAVGSAASADIPDYQAALDAVKSTSVRDAVCRFLSVPVPQGGMPGTPQAIPDKANPCEGMPAFTLKDPVAVNEISPGFVAGTSQPIATEAVKLGGLVSTLNAPVNGRNVTVMLSPTAGGGWHMAAVREGDTDAGYASQATLGTVVFTEPQIRGWYALKTLNTVEPLNAAARDGLGGQTSVSLADYQKLVKARYADKLPGSTYDTKGFSSGFNPKSPAHDSSSSSSLITGTSGAALALIGAGTFMLRRRKRAQRD